MNTWQGDRSQAKLIVWSMGILNEHQERLLRYECFLALGFGVFDSAKMLAKPGARGVGKVSYYFFWKTD